MQIIAPEVTLLTITEEPALLLELAGRTCYKSEGRITPGSADKFIGMICRNKHESVLEHATATFRLVCDRGISHEVVRHRIASYSQESTRYCNYGKANEIKVIKPSTLPDKALDVWSEAVVFAEQAYLTLLDLGCKPEVARSVLPTCLKTELVMTANFRTWKHFIALRSHKTAHPDVVVIARKVEDILQRQCSAVFTKETK